MTVQLIETGTANVASMRAALGRLGADVVAATDVEHAPHVVLPGVGTFGAAMATLRSRGLVGPLQRRLAAGRPTLAVCVGLQVLATGSDESPGVEGLGWIDARVLALPEPVERPQLGWNRVGTDALYFANGYALRDAPGRAVAWADHGGPFVAAVVDRGVLGCQFHPELSGRAGQAWLRAWLSGEAPVLDGPTGRLTRRVIPCLDVRDGRVVKGVRFQGLRDAGDPVAAAARYEAEGADELVILDVSATPDGRAHAVDTVRAVRGVLGVPLTVGGGVRTVEDAARLLEAGADKVAVNTAAVADPTLLHRLSARFGRQCTVLSLDAARRGDGFEVVVRSGTGRTGRDAAGWAAEAVQRGAGEVLLTSWDRDGTGLGYDLALIAAVRAAVPVPIVASGGAHGPDAMVAAFDAGASAVLAASIFHDGHHTVADIHQRLACAGVAVRRTP